MIDSPKPDPGAEPIQPAPPAGPAAVPTPAAPSIHKPKKTSRFGGLFRHVLPPVMSAVERFLPRKKKVKKRLRGMLTKEQRRKRRLLWRRTHKQLSFSRPRRATLSPARLAAPAATAEKRVPERVMGRILPAAKPEDAPRPVAPPDDLTERVFLPVEKKTFAQKETHGIWQTSGKKGVLRADGTRAPEADPIEEPVTQEAIGGGVKGFFRDLFTRRPHAAPAKAAPVSASAPAPFVYLAEPLKSRVSAPPPAEEPVTQERIAPGIGDMLKGMFAKRPPAPKPHAPATAPAPAVVPSSASADLDALFTSTPAPEAPAVPDQKGKVAPPAPAAQVQPELPSMDLMPAEKTDSQTARRTSAPQETPAKTAAPAPAPAPAKVVAPKPAKPAAPAEIVYKAKPVHRQSGLAEFIGSIKYFGLGKERFSVIQNLATMLNAGLPLIDSLKTLAMETRVKPMKKLIGRIVELVENGSPLWRAMDDQHFFSPHAIALVRIGEEAGSLAENMEYLSAQQEKDQSLKNKVKMAMIYPTIVMVLMFIIVIGLGMFVLPNLVGVLFSLNVPLPLVTRLVIMFTEFFTEHGAVAVPSMLGGMVVLGILLKFTPLKIVGQWVLFKIPGIGTLVREATIARFGVILGGLVKAGVPLLEALRSLAEVTPVVSYKRFYERLLDHITLGDSFSKSFKILRGSEKLLPISVQQLIVTGEKSGSLADILLKVADIYEKKANNTAEKLPVILEPMLLLFIGGLVGTIAFAIIVPIYSIVGNIGN